MTEHSMSPPVDAARPNAIGSPPPRGEAHEGSAVLLKDVEIVIRDLLSHVPVDALACVDLRARMSSPQRFYHGLSHLALLWSRHLAIEHEPKFGDEHARCLAACAITFHDAVLETSRSDNEERSALLWRAAATEHLPAEDVLWVEDTIRATSDHLAASDAADCWRARLRLRILDLDLTPLGEDPPVFKRNTRLLRMEYPHLSFKTWDERRLEFLRKFQSAAHIYRGPEIAARFETPARMNIARELDEQHARSADEVLRDPVP